MICSLSSYADSLLLLSEQPELQHLVRSIRSQLGGLAGSIGIDEDHDSDEEIVTINMKSAQSVVWSAGSSLGSPSCR